MRSSIERLRRLGEKHVQAEEQAVFPPAALTPDSQPLLSVVVPAYNEAATLPAIVARLLKVVEAGEIIIVDDCSTDGTSLDSYALTNCSASTRLRRRCCTNPTVTSLMPPVHHRPNTQKQACCSDGYGCSPF